MSHHKNYFKVPTIFSSLKNIQNEFAQNNDFRDFDVRLLLDCSKRSNNVIERIENSITILSSSGLFLDE